MTIAITITTVTITATITITITITVAITLTITITITIPITITITITITVTLTITTIITIISYKLIYYYRIVIDDGLHSNYAMKLSLGVLWRALAKGGYFFIEDMGKELRFSAEIYGRKRFSTNTYRKLVMFSHKSPETSGSLRDNVIQESCTPVPS